MKLLGISGSLRKGSHNSALIRAAAAALPPGWELEILDGLAELPPFDEDLDEAGAPPAVQRLRDAVAGADAVLFATPEYNASIPGVLKNAVDWASRPFPDNSLRDRPTAVVGASTGLFGAIWAQAELRKVLEYTGARVVGEELPVGLADEAFGEGGELADPDLRARYADVVGTLAREASAVPA